MKIATWNIQRFTSRKQSAMLNTIQEQNADILVLTETYNTIEIDDCKNVKSKLLPHFIDGQEYRNGEIRTSLYTKFPILNLHETYNGYTSLCADIQTPIGIFTVYASIIGILGNVQPYFKNDLIGQLNDYDKIFPSKENIIVIGDLNTTFSGRVFPSHFARNTLNTAFDKFNLINLTKDIENNVDHIIISKRIAPLLPKEPIIWNKLKNLSDHIGICIEI
jgi:endonuclease/exonuclease/phosphatase (EEP) superfamily protein YafD